MKLIITFCLIALATVGAGCALPLPESEGKTIPTTATSTASDADFILYVSDSCPHCATVKGHIKQYGFDKDYKIEYKESYNNRDNTAELLQRADYCRIPIDRVGVPLLWDKQRCFMGDDSIIEYLDSLPKN
ncbi:MAG: hypothetical protein ACOYUZ_04475 [Patescibacteria group bacterium]